MNLIDNVNEKKQNIAFFQSFQSFQLIVLIKHFHNQILKQKIRSLHLRFHIFYYKNLHNFPPKQKAHQFFSAQNHHSPYKTKTTNKLSPLLPSCFTKSTTNQQFSLMITIYLYIYLYSILIFYEFLMLCLTYYSRKRP